MPNHSKTVASARALLAAGDVDGAVRALAMAGAHEEAARALSGANRFIEAADLLLASLRVPANQLAQVRDPHLRARAAQAAALLRRGGVTGAAEDVERQLKKTSVRSGPAPLQGEATVRERGPAVTAPVEQPEDTTEIDHGPAPERLAPARPAVPVGRTSTGSAAPRARTPAPPRRPSSTAFDALSDGSFHEGATIDGRYLLGRLIGRGAMARVFAAHDRELGTPIAIKVFDRMDDATLLARFKQELLSSRQIAHPNVLRLFDIGTFRDQKYLTMELLVGRDLKERLKDPIALSESLELLAQACRGLGAAHAVGVVHRDIKPQNLFLCDTHALKLMDFGIAKLQAAAKLTVPGAGVGTPEFMAPEQIMDSSQVSPATDLYAIGVTAYRMCTGRVPFAGKEIIDLLRRQLREPPRPPREHNPRLPAQLEALILALLAKDPADRPQDANEVAEQFAALRKRFATT